MSFKHGHTRFGAPSSRTYYAWQAMLRRCLNPKNPSYPDYGGRGITVCPEWDPQQGGSFERFLADMGEVPSGLMLERARNHDGYYKGNCRWATRKEQNRNTRANHVVSFNGETHCVTDWAVKLGKKPRTLFNRLERGWSIERALTTI